MRTGNAATAAADGAEGWGGGLFTTTGGQDTLAGGAAASSTIIGCSETSEEGSMRGSRATNGAPCSHSIIEDTEGTGAAAEPPANTAAIEGGRGSQRLSPEG